MLQLVLGAQFEYDGKKNPGGLDIYIDKDEAVSMLKSREKRGIWNGKDGSEDWREEFSKKSFFYTELQRYMKAECGSSCWCEEWNECDERVQHTMEKRGHVPRSEVVWWCHRIYK